MIKKLRWKFILINMTFVVSILITVLGLFYYANLKRLERQTEVALMQSIDRDRFNFPPDRIEFGRRPKDNPPPLISSFIVTMKMDHTVGTIEKNNITVTEETASSLALLVDSKDSTQGVLKDYSLRYVKINTPEGTKIGFADQSLELNNAKSMLLNCLLIFFIAVILFLLLSLYLSRLALKPVETAWQQQNQFIADASHELKTPLTVILANLDILSSHRECTISDQKKWLDNTTEEASRMKQLVESLLFLARSDAGTMSAVKNVMIPLDFSDLVLNGVLLFESIAFENKVTLENHIESGITLTGCESQLKQVVTILLDNACKYAGKNGTVSVELKKTAHSTVLSVCNSGEIIPAEEQKLIFERFYRTDKSRMRKEGGYGLGLSIAKTILEQHNGKITVSSSSPAGTTFTVSLPLL